MNSPTADNLQCRMEFEKWHKERYPERSLELDKNGNYECGSAPIVFRGYQAGYSAKNDLLAEMAEALELALTAIPIATRDGRRLLNQKLLNNIDLILAKYNATIKG